MLFAAIRLANASAKRAMVASDVTSVHRRITAILTASVGVCLVLFGCYLLLWMLMGNIALKTECGCNEKGSSSLVCRISGQCPCLNNFSGRRCSQCSPGFFNYPDCTGKLIF